MIFKPDFLNADAPLAEYPRPQMKRNSYISLNGEWDYAISTDPNAQTSGKIVVPYSPECKLSGVERQLKKDEYLIYERAFTLPKGFNRGRVLLNTGACDQICEIFVNGQSVGKNYGGYLPFTFDITDALVNGENTLKYVVTDDADSDVYGRGKQTYKRGGIWYTATSGIWQSVWLESVPKEYIKSIKLTPDYDNKKLSITCDLTGISKNMTVKITDGENIIATTFSYSGEAKLDVSACREWTTESPELYTVTVTYFDDVVESYFGLRKFSTVNKNGKRLFALNNKPIFHNGLLDQGYWSDGLYTPPSNKAMYDEVAEVKSLGYNMLRKHIKIEPLLWYYYCDICGMLVWQDMINGGGRYPTWRISLAPFINLNLDDSNYKAMRRPEASRKQYMIEAKGTIELLYNCVGLCLWTPFNEAWGQFDAVKVWKELKKLDNTRPYDHASGWQDKGGGDVCSKHIYFRKARLQNDGKRVLALTEFGGYSFSLEGHTFTDKKFGYKTFKNADRLSRAYRKLYENEIIPLIIQEGLCATVYTELTDVEDEVNGIYTFDRVLKFDGDVLKEINQKVMDAFNKKYNYK